MPRRKSGLTKEQDQFIEWLVTPDQMRIPKTQKEFAAEIHASTRVLAKWKQDSKFREAWDLKLHEMNINPENTQAVLDAMHRQALRGNVKAAELWLRVMDRYRPSVEVHSYGSVEELTDEELEEELAGLMEAQLANRGQFEDDDLE